MADEESHEEGGEVMKISELTPEQKAEAARQLKKLLLGDEPGDDDEVFYYLSPFPEDSDEPDEEGDDAK